MIKGLYKILILKILNVGLITPIIIVNIFL